MSAVEAAVTALRAFGETVDRDSAAILLSMWSRRGELSPRDRLAVLDQFGSPPAQPAHEGCRVGSRWAR